MVGSPGVIRSVAAVRDIIAAGDVDIAECLRGTRLRPEDMARPGGTIRLCDELRILSNVATARPDHSALGLDAGLRCCTADFGVVGVLMRSSATLADVLTDTIRFQDLCHPLPVSTQQSDGDAVAVTIDPSRLPSRLRDVAVDQQLAAVATIFGELGGCEAMRIRSLELARTSPRYAERYAEMYGVRPIFQAPANRIVFQVGQLVKPLPSAVAEAVPQLREACVALLCRRRARPGTAGAVVDIMERHDGAVPGLEAVACELHMSARSLRRRLREEGTSFRALDGEARLRRATFLLETTTRSVQSIGDELGYAASPAFVQAFKRWTGQPPGAYRRAGSSVDGQDDGTKVVAEDRKRSASIRIARDG